MKRKPVQVILMIAISLAICASSAYAGYYAVASADFLSPNLGLEVFDQEYLWTAHQNESKAFDASVFTRTVQLEIFPFWQFPHSPSQTSSLDRKTLVLRC